MCNANREFIINADLIVNGERVVLNNFVEGFISQTVIGMLKSLKGIGDIETIDLKISKKAKGS